MERVVRRPRGERGTWTPISRVFRAPGRETIDVLGQESPRVAESTEFYGRCLPTADINIIGFIS